MLLIVVLHTAFASCTSHLEERFYVNTSRPEYKQPEGTLASIPNERRVFIMFSFVARIAVVDGSSMRIIDEPVAPSGQASPNSVRNGLSSFVIGFLLATVLLVFMDLVYDTVQGNEDIESRYGVAVIGHIPDMFQAERATERYSYKVSGGNRR